MPLTMQVGKWYEGMATPQYTPVGRGFESFFANLQHSNDYYSEVMGTYNNKTGIIDFWDTDKPA